MVIVKVKKIFLENRKIETKSENFTLLFLRYVLENYKIIISFLIFSIIYCLVFYLYNILTEAVIYATLMCIFIGSIILSINFYFYYKKVVFLNELKKSIILHVDNLPKAENIIEEKYQKLIIQMHINKTKLISQNDINKKDMEDYFTIWAHQIKTPISAMSLTIQSMNKTEYSTLMETELFKIDQYVNMILQYIRIGSSSSDFLIKYYDLDDIIKQCIRKYSKIFIMKKIKLEFLDLDKKVITDEKWLLFAIEQIVSNSLKYTQKGKISIYMDKENKNVLVIEDTGIGIEEEDLPRIFERGFTGYNGRIDKKATGIGLSLCKKILNKLSHEITIESKVFIGTKVKIHFKE